MRINLLLQFKRKVCNGEYSKFNQNNVKLEQL